ncbi:hypothetical protein D0Z08_28310 [Nocardioides immobilis]|uniref:Uncharacterized protein n=1 Tax=Nocardioides immobilis TaxID=2049295 RepID=A0A417XT84_9ACTN|nr:hypothetical protein [Nocardioides immobilis]RHW23714.1 hypothetical protein D0Z08_28310 [Nocardioides immobilis]
MSDYRPSEVELVWPARIFRPFAKLVYLDLNHFIYLARSQAEAAPAGLKPYSELFDAALLAVQDERVIFPLSTPHVYEMAAIKDPKQRIALADVMEQLSGFRYLLGRPEIAQCEIEEAFDRHFDSSPIRLPLNLIGTSLGWAFGMKGGLLIKDRDGNDVSDRVRAELGDEVYEAKMAEANLMMERSLLRGPSDEEIPALRANGYPPEKSEATHRSRVDFELDLAKKLDADDIWRRGRLRDVVAARELTHEWLDHITTEATARGISLDEVVSDRHTMRRFSDGMPSTRVAVSVKTRYHRDPNHEWTPNDINDIDAMSVAVPYCDAVFTDKAIRNALASSPELRCLGTFLPRRPQELTQWLRDVPVRQVEPRLAAPGEAGDNGARAW